MQTLAKLNDPLDFQAIAVGNRALLEILVDLILLHSDRTYESAAKVFWWGESEKLKSSEQIIDFYSEQNLTVPDEFEAQQVLHATRKTDIEIMRKTFWPDKDPSKHPIRWTGNRSLLQDVKRADQLYAAQIKREIGSTLEEYYQTQYRKMNWQIHSGVASLGDQPPQAFYLTSGFGFKWCADFGLFCTKITLIDFGLDRALADLAQEWEHIRSNRNSVIARELYKFTLSREGDSKRRRHLRRNSIKSLTPPPPAPPPTTESS